jgi:hypothetical protein
MPPTVTIVHVREEEERRLVHILAALRTHLRDELRYQAVNPTDPRSTPLALRDQLRLHVWLWNELTHLMFHTHAGEWSLVDPEEDSPWQATKRQYFLPGGDDTAHD